MQLTATAVPSIRSKTVPGYASNKLKSVHSKLYQLSSTLLHSFHYTPTCSTRLILYAPSICRHKLNLENFSCAAISGDNPTSSTTTSLSPTPNPSLHRMLSALTVSRHQHHLTVCRSYGLLKKININYISGTDSLGTFA